MQHVGSIHSHGAVQLVDCSCEFGILKSDGSGAAQVLHSILCARALVSSSTSMMLANTEIESLHCRLNTITYLFRLASRRRGRRPQEPTIMPTIHYTQKAKQLRSC